MRVSKILKMLGTVVGLMAAVNGFCEAQVPNGSFEEGEKWPAGWKLRNGIGAWENEAHSGKKCVSITGDGTTIPMWNSDCFSLEPNNMYRLSVWLMALQTNRVAFGTSQIFWEFGISPEWKQYDFIFRTSDTPQPVSIRFWTRLMRTKAFFDDITIATVKPVYLNKDGIELGEGERIKDNFYIATGTARGTGGPDSRYLFKEVNGHFSGNRWYVSSDVIFRHKAGEIMQTEASFKFHVGWNPCGKVVALASNDGKNFKQVYEGRKLYWTDIITLPADLFPAKEIYIRFRCLPIPEEKGRPVFELTGYEYKAKLAEKIPDLEGKTEFIEITK